MRWHMDSKLNPNTFVLSVCASSNAQPRSSIIGIRRVPLCFISHFQCISHRLYSTPTIFFSDSSLASRAGVIRSISKIWYFRLVSPASVQHIVVNKNLLCGPDTVAGEWRGGRHAQKAMNIFWECFGDVVIVFPTFTFIREQLHDGSYGTPISGNVRQCY